MNYYILSYDLIVVLATVYGVMQGYWYLIFVLLAVFNPEKLY